MGQNFSDATLVLLGHGTSLNPDSAAPVYHHASHLRGSFAEVREAFWKQEPQVKKILSEFTNHRIFIVPLFISEGYFGEEIIPRELGFRIEGQEEWSRVLQRGPQTFFYCKPIGTHPAMTDVILERAREVVEKNPFPRAPKMPEITLIIAGHGTAKNDNSRKSIERQVELIRERKIYAAVHAVFLEEEPGIGACYELAGTRNIVVTPFFISEGLHTQEDIPVLLGEPERIVRQRRQAGHPAWRNPTEKKGKLVWYSQSVGTAPQVSNIILDRVQEAERWQ